MALVGGVWNNFTAYLFIVKLQIFSQYFIPNWNRTVKYGVRSNLDHVIKIDLIPETTYKRHVYIGNINNLYI